MLTVEVNGEWYAIMLCPLNLPVNRSTSIHVDRELLEEVLNDETDN